ncbi:helix-hairpin-helix domain-containing protein [Patescibacteria group bacterium]|nr:helix-hairpin-helix domain-containing protein [Patescibacteria group bacterium]
MKDKETILKELQTIPGVGKEIAKDLYDLGYDSVADLKDREPHIMYERLCIKEGRHVDRCVLYVFRCAVYYASHEKHDPEKLKWWNWKDEGEVI